MRYIRKIGFLQILCLMLLLISANDEPKQQQGSKRIEKRGVVENFGEGLKFAGQMFGINTAADVANLVAMAFSKTKPSFMSLFQQKQHQPNSSGDGESDTAQYQGNNSQQSLASMKNEQRQKQYQQQQQQQEQEPQQQEGYESAEQSKEQSNKQEFSPSRFVVGVLRMIGFDASKLGALAINAIVMIAEAIGNAFIPPARLNDDSSHTQPYSSEDEGIPEALSRGHRDAHQPRALREGTPIDWYMENPSKGMRRLLDDALDSQLTDRITEMIERTEEREGQKAGCIKMLMCKSSPIIWGMQRSVSERVTGRAVNATKQEVQNENEAESAQSKPKRKKLFSTEGFFAYLPTMEEFLKHNALCDERFGRECSVNGDMDASTVGDEKSQRARQMSKGNKISERLELA